MSEEPPRQARADRRAPGPRRMLLAAVVLAGLFSFTGIFNHSLWTPDEPRAAEIGREMLLGGDYVVPTLGGSPFLEKPPLYWWTMTVAYRLFGVSDGVARLPSAVFGFLLLLLALDLARRAAGARAGLFAVCVLGTTLNFQYVHRSITDPALAFWVGLGYWAFWRSGGTERDRAGVRGGFVLLLYLAAGLAFWSKGIVGVVLLLGPVGIYALATGRRSFFRSRSHLPGLAGLLLLCATWPVLLYLRGGRELLDGFLLDNVLHRFLPGPGGTAPGGHQRPIWAYLAMAPADLLPWTVALPALYGSLLRKRGSALRAPGLGFAASVLPLGVLLLSLPATKRGLYLLPLVAPTAVALGVWLASLELPRPSRRGDRVTLEILGGLAIAVLAVVMLVSGLLLAGFSGGWAPIARISEEVSPAVLAAGLLLPAAAIPLLLALRRRGGSPAGSLLAAWVSVFLLVNLVAYPLLEPVKSLRPFVEGLSERGAFDPELLGFKLDETTLGIVPFYSGRLLSNVEQKEPLLDLLRERPEAKLLVFERYRRRLPEDLELLGRWEISSHRVYLLLGPGDRGR